MGKHLIDQFSLLHFSTGVVAYFIGLNFIQWFIVHAIFEFTENTDQGIYFIDHYLKFWPGGKKGPDSLTNSVGDQLFALLGFVVALILDNYGKQYGWADLDINSHKNHIFADFQEMNVVK